MPVSIGTAGPPRRAAWPRPWAATRCGSPWPRSGEEIRRTWPVGDHYGGVSATEPAPILTTTTTGGGAAAAAAAAAKVSGSGNPLYVRSSAAAPLVSSELKTRDLSVVVAEVPSKWTAAWARLANFKHGVRFHRLEVVLVEPLRHVLWSWKGDSTASNFMSGK